MHHIITSQQTMKAEKGKKLTVMMEGISVQSNGKISYELLNDKR